MILIRILAIAMLLTNCSKDTSFQENRGLDESSGISSDDIIEDVDNGNPETPEASPSQPVLEPPSQIEIIDIPLPGEVIENNELPAGELRALVTNNCLSKNADELSQVRINRNNVVETYNSNQSFALLINGNNNGADIDFVGEQGIEAMCIVIDGNDNQININIDSNVQGIYLAVNGNNSSINVNVGSGKKVQVLHRATDGKAALVNINM